MVEEPSRIDLTVPMPDGAVATGATDPNAAFLRLENGQAFVRCLLPVALTGGSTLMYLTWLELGEEDFRSAVTSWRGHGWADVVLRGVLGTDLEPWSGELRGAEVVAAVGAADEPPTVTSTDHPVLHRILTETWDRNVVLSWFPGPLPTAVRVRVGRHWSLERGAGMVAGLAGRTWRFGGPGRSVFAEVLSDPRRRPPGEFLRELLADAPGVPARQTLITPSDDEITHAFWLETVVDGRAQTDLYAHVVRRGSALSIGVVHEDPADHEWALDVLSSVRHHS